MEIKFIGYEVRADNRVEIVCEHGVGHTSPYLTKIYREFWNDEYDGIHGCCGCCLSPKFKEAEEDFADRFFKEEKEQYEKKLKEKRFENFVSLYKETK